MLIEGTKDEEVKNKMLNFKTLREIWPKCFWLIINLFSVYIFEYSIITCFADRMKLRLEDKFPEQKDEFHIK